MLSGSWTNNLTPSHYCGRSASWDIAHWCYNKLQMYLFYFCLCCSQVHNLLVFSYSDHKQSIIPPLISQTLLCRFFNSISICHFRPHGQTIFGKSVSCSKYCNKSIFFGSLFPVFHVIFLFLGQTRNCWYQVGHLTNPN